MAKKMKWTCNTPLEEGIEWAKENKEVAIAIGTIVVGVIIILILL